jgi:hypothetical protein
MDDGITPNLLLIKPDIGASDDTWGDKLNRNFDILDGAVQTTPVPLPANNPPLVAGTAAPGTSTLYSRGDHVHPNDPSKVDAATIGETIDDRVAGLLIAGTNIALTYNDPANTLRIDSASAAPATAVPLVESGSGAVGISLKYAREDHVHPLGPGGGGGASVTISDTPPASPTAGNLWWESDTGNLYIYYFDGNSSQWVAIGSVRSNTIAVGQCRLAISGANLALMPFGGNVITINGVSCTIPATGVALAPTGLTVSGLYYIYAVATAGVVTSLEASATAHATSSTPGNAGVEIKSGDDTRTLVGMARVIIGPAWADTPAQRFVRSWFNDPGIYSFNQFATTRQTAAAAYAEVNSEIRIEALIWTGETWDVTQYIASFSNTVTNSNSFSTIGFNGAVPEKNGILVTIVGAIAGTAFGAGCSSAKAGLTEGYNFATVIGKCDAGTASWTSSADGNRTIMKGYARR